MPIASFQPFRSLLAIAVATALPILGFALIVAVLVIDAKKLEIEERYRAVATALLSAVEVELDSQVRSLRNLAASPSLLVGDLSTFHGHARAVVQQQNDLILINLQSTDGEAQLLSTTYTYPSHLPAPPRPEEIRQVARSGEPMIGSFAPSGAVVTQYYFPVRVPVMHDGVAKYVLSAAVSPSSISAIVRSQGVPENYLLSVVDPSYRIVARSGNTNSGVGQMAPARFQDHARTGSTRLFRNVLINGSVYMRVLVTSERHGWRVVVGQTEAAYNAAIRATLLPVGLAGAIAALLSAAIAVLLSRALGKRWSAAERSRRKELAIARDQAQESEKRYRGLVQSQTDIVVRFNGNGLFTFVNDTFCATVGLSGHALLGRSWRAFVLPDDLDQIDHALADAASSLDHRARLGIRLVTVAGCRWFQCEAVAIFGETGTFQEFQAVGRDITAERAMEGALLKARIEAERANEAKSRFLAAASHDLRQPFQAMNLYREVLRQRLTTAEDQRVLAALSTAMEAGEDLLKTLLDLSTLEAGITEPRFEMVTVSDLITPLAQEIRLQAAARGLRLRQVPCSAKVRTDPVLFSRMLRNLLVNALKYTPSGTILLGCRRVAGAVRVEVWDTGPGIPPDKHQDVFEEFTQLGNPERDRTRGLGLGLAVVAKTGRLLDHPVGVRSRVNKGSMFFVEVPVAEGTKMVEEALT